MSIDTTAAAADFVNVAADSAVINGEGIESTNAKNANETVKLVEFSKIKVDKTRNPRKEIAYSEDKLNTLARNVDQFGLIDALVVSKRADGSMWLVKGHRRYFSILQLQETGVKEGSPKKDYPAIAADPNKFRKVKCRVLEGMSVQDELDMLMDHVDAVGLDPQEKYLSAKILTRAGFNHEFIARKVGMSRSNYSNHLARIIAMPSCVEERYLSDDKTIKKPTQEDCKPLYDAYMADLKAGGMMKQAGPKFSEAWEKYVNLETTPREKMIPRSDLITQLGGYDHPLILAVFQAVINNRPNDLGNALTDLQDALRTNHGVTVISEGIEKSI